MSFIHKAHFCHLLKNLSASVTIGKLNGQNAREQTGHLPLQRIFSYNCPSFLLKELPIPYILMSFFHRKLA